jgi:hypothetical protein
VVPEEALFRREESLRQLLPVSVCFQVIFQFVRIRRVTSRWSRGLVGGRNQFSGWLAFMCT